MDGILVHDGLPVVPMNFEILMNWAYDFGVEIARIGTPTCFL
jgi:hypothetical protein